MIASPLISKAVASAITRDVIKNKHDNQEQAQSTTSMIASPLISKAAASAITRDVIKNTNESDGFTHVVGNGESAIYRAKVAPNADPSSEKKQIHVPGNRVTRFNIMVVGESGLGKTTFLKTLLKDYSQDELIQHSGEKTCGINRVGEVELTQQGGETVLVTFVDSAGYGDEIDNKKHFDPIINHITNQFRAHKQDKDAEKFDDDELRIRDERIHCCFYFVAPHRFKELDRKFMEMLQDYVPIVPIVAKADTMMTQEKEEHVARIEEIIREKGLSIFKFKSTPLSMCGCPNCSVDQQSNKADLKADPTVFSIIADANSEKRVYPWGEAYVKCKHHSDFAALQELLFDCGDFDLAVRDTNKKYQSYVNQERQKEAIRNRGRRRFFFF